MSFKQLEKRLHELQTKYDADTAALRAEHLKQWTAALDEYDRSKRETRERMYREARS